MDLAQCLLHDPDVLILDEPTNGLDPAGIREIRDHVRMLAREKNMAVIVSSHLLSEMEMMCDRIGIIQKGKLVDVQHIQDFVQDTEKVFSFEITNRTKALQVIKANFAQIIVQQTDLGLSLAISKEQVPDIVKLFVENEISIFGIHEITKTLEERFLEVTETKGEAIHA